MKSIEQDNPFSATNYIGPDYFCDRKEETRNITQYLRNGNSVTLIAIRRIGKTGLIHHVLNKLPRSIKAVYVDILDTENINQFLNRLSTSIISQFPERTGYGKKIWTFVKSLRPVINYDPLTGTPQASFTVGKKETEININALFQFLEQQESKVIIAIDEFQQILQYPEKNTDAWLRTRIQSLKNINFIFSGSQQHLMNELFTHPQKPFYRSTQLLKLGKIKQSEYRSFIIKMFDRYDKKIDKSVANNILLWTDSHTFFTQQLCNRVFTNSDNVITDSIWKEQAHNLLKEQETMFFSFRNILSKQQWKLLKAIAKEGKVFKPTSQAFIQSNSLSTSATIIKSLKMLLNTELIFKDFDKDGNMYYSVYDVFFRRWCESRID